MKNSVDAVPIDTKKPIVRQDLGEAFVASNSNIVLASTAVRDEAGQIGLRICDLAHDYAVDMPGRPFDVMIDLFRQYGLSWDDVDPGQLFHAFNPRRVNMYDTMEGGSPRVGFFGGANKVWNRESAESGMPLRAFLGARSPALANATVDQIIRVATTGTPLLQYVRIEDRRVCYHRLMLPATNGDGSPTKVLAFVTPATLGFGPSAMTPPPGTSYN